MNTIKNSVRLIGRLGDDVEIIELDGESAVVFRMATNETYQKKNGNRVTKVQWHSIVSFDKVAERIKKSLRKGDEVVICGKIQYRDILVNGKTEYCAEIHVSDFHKTAVKKVNEPILSSGVKPSK